MVKKYFKKIIAQSPQDLQVISACCEGGKIKIDEIKYLPKNKIFLFLVERVNKDEKESKKKIKSIIKFAYITSTKLKNFKFCNKDEIFELLAIDLLKKDQNYEIVLLFSNNRFITLNAEVVDIELTDQMIENDKDN